VTSSLGRSGDVRRVLSDGQRRSSDLLSVHALLRATPASDAAAAPPGTDVVDPDAVRLTTVASKRVGNAVQRNRAKRMLREAARAVAWTPGHDVVLVARSATVTTPLDALIADVVRLGRGVGAVVPAGGPATVRAGGPR
jgi:ribonuclease P protein component